MLAPEIGAKRGVEKEPGYIGRTSQRDEKLPALFAAVLMSMGRRPRAAEDVAARTRMLAAVFDARLWRR